MNTPLAHFSKNQTPWTSSREFLDSALSQDRHVLFSCGSNSEFRSYLRKLGFSHRPSNVSYLSSQVLLCGCIDPLVIHCGSSLTEETLEALEQARVIYRATEYSLTEDGHLEETFREESRYGC